MIKALVCDDVERLRCIAYKQLYYCIESRARGGLLGGP